MTSVDELTPEDAFEFGLQGVGDNKLVVTGLVNLAIDGGYTGDAYTFAGPPDTVASPIQLGFKKGDKLKLEGPVGGESNDGRELTLVDPATIEVFEELVTPDVTLYTFQAIRRRA